MSIAAFARLCTTDSRKIHASLWNKADGDGLLTLSAGFNRTLY
jgi:hypothetical protein